MRRAGTRATYTISTPCKIEPEQDSLRIDIPKDDVPEYSRRIDGVNYVVTERPEWMDMKPIQQLVNEVWQKKK